MEWGWYGDKHVGWLLLLFLSGYVVLLLVLFCWVSNKHFAIFCFLIFFLANNKVNCARKYATVFPLPLPEKENSCAWLFHCESCVSVVFETVSVSVPPNEFGSADIAEAAQLRR